MKRKQGFLKWSYHTAYTSPTILKGTTFAYHSDDTITFFDLTTNQQIFYHAFGGDSGDGISCVTGHNSYSLFAFAELKYNPSIYIMLYPSMEKIKTLESNRITKYIDIRFTDSEYLICLTGYPLFTIVVWNYRKGVIMGEYRTDIKIEKQKLICGPNGNLCAQYSSISRELNIWEINSTSEKVFLIKKNIKLSFISDEANINLTFGFDGNLYLIDSNGIFYVIHGTTCSFKKLWTWNDDISPTQDEGLNWHIEIYKGGFLIFGSDNRLKFLKKDKIWNVIFTIEFDTAISWLKSINNFEKIYFLTIDGKIKLLMDDSEQPTIEEIGETGPLVKSFSIINPFAKYVALLLQSNEIRIIEIATGDVLSKIQVHDALYFKSFPTLPTLIVGSSDGTLKFISCYEAKDPKIITDFKLNSYKVKEILFTENYIVTLDCSKTFFIIKGQLGGPLKVVKYFQIKYDIYKIVANEMTATSLRLYIIPWKDYQLQMELILIIYENDEIIEQKYPLKFHIIDIITFEKRLLVARLKFNEVYELIFDNENIIYNLWKKTTHLIKDVRLYGIQNTVMTWGLDGIIATYDFDSKSLNYSFPVQNRRNEMDYIILGQCTPNQKRCLILTKKGTFKIFITKEKVQEMIVNVKLDNYFNTSTTSPYRRSISGRSWIEDMSFKKIQGEKIKFASKRTKVMEDFQNITKKLQLLVDENEALEDPDDRVPLNSLNLAKEYAQNIIDKANKNLEEENKFLKEYIADQNRITTLILSQTWSHMLTKNQKVFGIFTHLECENYALSQFDLKKFQNIETKLNIHRKREKSSDIWYPFLPPWQKNLNDSQKKKSTLISEDKSESLVGSEIETISKTEKYSLSGTATYLFVDPHPAQYHQFETVTYSQMYIQNFLVEFDVRQLKQSFNKIFETMVKSKQDSIKYVKMRNCRFREIQTEQNALAVLRNDEPNYSRHIEDPEFALQENAESLTKVEDWEVKIKRYISPSEQKLVNEMAYKEELRRLALLADDFRERALIVMMDGVLEKRWEDEIKRDVLKPDCLLKNKDPTEYTKDDIRSINEYEEKVKFIYSERERYREMLTEEEKKLQEIQDDNILKFNLKCGELFLQKLNYDAAVKQEELKLLRTSFFNFQRMKFKQREQVINNNLSEKRQKVDELTAVIIEIEKKVNEYQQKYEQLQNRDRSMEKGFKSQYGESAPAFVLDTAYKSFKRRPKWQQKVWATANIYTELANIIANKISTKTAFPLPADCYEYLNLLENNDNYSQAPSIIDQKLWEILCRLRRSKIESEFRLKGLGLQLAETETTLNLFIKDVSATKSVILSLEKDLKDLNSAYQEFFKNRTIQVVMSMGIVEVPLSGRMYDFQGSLLLSRADIDDINAIIKRAGEKKLKTMHRLAVFRRKVLMKEWEHKALQMSVQDLKDFLNVVDHTNVTFEMRQWLREKSERRLVDITNSYLRRKVEAKLAYLNKSIKEIDEEIEECIIKIEEQKIENSKLDKAIKSLNVDVTENNLNRDLLFEEKQVREQKERMIICMERSKLIRKVQAGHIQMLELATLLELQKLKTYPTLNPLMKNFCLSST